MIGHGTCASTQLCSRRRRHLVGSAEVVSSREGAYLGNWLGDAEARATTQDLVLEIARAGAARGYRGCSESTWPNCRTVALAYDLNFRLCGSTTPLMAAPAVMARRAAVARMRPWLLDMRSPRRPGSSSVPESGLVPLAVFDPAPHGLQGPIRVTSLVVGQSRPRSTSASARSTTSPTEPFPPTEARIGSLA